MFRPTGCYSPGEEWGSTKTTKAPTEAHAPFGAFALRSDEQAVYSTRSSLKLRLPEASMIRTT